MDGVLLIDEKSEIRNFSVESLDLQPGRGLGRYQQVSDVIKFTIGGNGFFSIEDVDLTTSGVQTRVVIDLTDEVVADSYLKLTSSGLWVNYLDDQDLATYDDGATLLDTNNNGKIDRVVLTITDGGVGDYDGLVNGEIVDPGFLANGIYEASLSISDDYLTFGEQATVTIVFNDEVDGFNLDDLTSPNGTFSNLSGPVIDDEGYVTYTVLFTPGSDQNTDSGYINLGQDYTINGVSGAGASLTNLVIRNDSPPSVSGITADDPSSLSLGDASVTEATPNGNLTYTVNLSTATTVESVYALALSGTSAATDYGTFEFSNGVTYTSGNLIVPVGVSSFTITVPVVDDDIDEVDETLILTIGGVDATGTILDNDEPLLEEYTPTVNLVTVDSNKLEGGGSRGAWTPFTYRVELSEALSSPLVINWNVVGYGDNPTDRNDFVGYRNNASPSGTLTLQPGQTSADIVLKVVADYFFAQDDSFRISISTTSNLVELNVSNLIGTIFNDDNLIGNNRNNNLLGSNSSEFIDGKSGDDIIYGRAGDDVITGGLGIDRLWGGSGEDIFLFNTSLGRKNFDTIFDFEVIDDQIYLDNSIFKKLITEGVLSDQNFLILGSRPQDSNDFVVFNSSNGALSYDSDGFGSVAAIHFATIDLIGLVGTLSSSDFVII